MHPLLTSLLLIFIVIVSGLLLRRLIQYLQTCKLVSATFKDLCRVSYNPAVWMVWIIGAILVIEYLFYSLFELSYSPIGQARRIILTLFITWIAYQWKIRYVYAVKKRVESRKEVLSVDLIIAISKALSVLIFVVSALIILDIMDIQPTALLAFGGVGGLAVGFAAKDVVANFFGGLMIHINRHFSVGELIVSTNKSFQGYVEDIGWYMTKIRSFSRTPIYVPNALFIDAVIENMGRMYNRRIKHIVGVRYKDIAKIKPIVNEIRAMVEKESEIDRQLPIFVNFSSFSPYSLDIEIICYTKTKERKLWAEVQQNIFLKIADIISKNGAEIAFPTNTVYLEEG